MDKEVFARFAFRRHLALEVGVSGFKGPDSYPDCSSVGSETNPVVSYYEENHYYFVNLRIQYGFSCGHVKGLKHYPGIVLSPGQVNRNLISRFRSQSTGEITTYGYADNDLIFQAGIEDRIQYDLTKHLQVHALLSYKQDFHTSLLHHGFGVQLGGDWLF